MLSVNALTAVSMALKLAGIAGVIAGVTALFAAQSVLIKSLKHTVIENN
jgi:hypothetical protein